MNRPQSRTSWFGTLALVGSLAIATAQEETSARNSLEGLTVIGSSDAVFDLGGSAAYLESEFFRERGYTDIEKILAIVPGVYVRQEDGYGNFPNISIRGGDGTRAEKVTVMEDGILTAPAPYSAPAAYYFPKSGRMSSIEVLKGSSQVRYGPQTTGGVLNFLSTPVPQVGDPSFFSRTTIGSDSRYFNHTWFGDVIEGAAGRFGYLLEYHGETTDGFRHYSSELDKDTGFSFHDPNLKVFWEPNGMIDQRFELKLGLTAFESHDGYLGLTERDAEFSEDIRYASTQFDNMDSKQYRSYLKYILKPNDSLDIESAVYWNNFERNWYKLDQVSLSSNPVIDGRGRIASGAGRTGLAQALLAPTLVAVLEGFAPGSIGVKANARYYDAYGWQNRATWQFETGNVGHQLTAGVRFHYDRVFREQFVDVFNGVGSGTFEALRYGIPGEESNRLEESKALAVYLEDSLTIGQLTLTPGLRYERIDYSTTNFNGADGKQEADFGVWAGGMGFAFEIDSCNSIYGGVFRGFSLPGPNSYINDEVREEQSTGYELGYRYQNDGVSVDTAAFFTDFSNLIGTDNGLANGTNLNAGSAEVYGLEGIVRYDPAISTGASFNVPVYVSATWTSAELKDALIAGGGENIYAGGTDGSAIPYVPSVKLAAGIGFATDQWGVNLDAYYASKSFGTAANLDAPSTSSRQGKIDPLFTVDFSAHYTLSDNLKLVGGIQNIFDQRAITTRIPEGPRTNLPRTWFTGIEATF